MQYESGGEFYFLTVHRVLFGLGVSNVIVGFYMVVNRLYGHGLLMLPLPVICWGFASFCDKAYVEPSARMALNEAAAVERRGPSPEHLSRRFDEQLYRQPVLGDAVERASRRKAEIDARRGLAARTAERRQRRSASTSPAPDLAARTAGRRRAASTSPARRAAPDDLAARTAERRRRTGR